MTKNSNIYPHLPIVKYELDGPPWAEPFSDPSLVVSFRDDGSLNVTDDSISALTAEIPELGDIPGCVDFLDPNQPKVLTVDSLVKPSAYPDDYNKQVSSWLQDLVTATSTNPGPTSSAQESQKASQSQNAPAWPGFPGT